MTRIKVRYGDAPEQFGHFYPPRTPQAGPVPVVTVIHGGFWQARYGLAVETPFARDLAHHGVAVWNIEYRRLGAGGLWPEMSQDVVSAFEALAGPVAAASSVPLDLDRIRVVGHSAGGQLAVWLAGQRGGRLRPEWVVSQAGALDLASAAERGRRIGYIEEMFGTSYRDDPAVYRSASPQHRLPAGTPVLCLHGTEDVQVPEAVSRRYVSAAVEAGDRAALRLVDGEDHFAFLTPGSTPWQLSRAALLAPDFGSAVRAAGAFLPEQNPVGVPGPDR
ncbi:prolyl oligopeptidase family serine peptidase [Rhodococcus triatomae]|uniref:Prolyl oligopeptidase family protein n=1 Tax=Rhodococcus triatomae TaxID=300028 RepID=A0A1G8DJJ4_9NOCA|nr:prolyl oligopeptidase family serine peptidase [Rhodococcus triatomae]QNG18414.1 prolyl oligopeptidase family serine peptidase [Rhodococcus triatomae]QNG21916.1 prolyl oligopeptidase family serine peptidase [Rhodococcus triatomae]SDH57843.1 Prolyl oligopeptidase family protein [Rhodococcus triatomae]